jgi:Winged helix DNA-binding domain
VRLVAEFDNLVLSHADRTRIISDANRGRLFTVNGIFPGTVLIGGFVAGIWKLARSAAAAALTIEMFEPVSAQDRAAVISEGELMLAFAAPDTGKHDVRFAPIT